MKFKEHVLYFVLSTLLYPNWDNEPTQVHRQERWEDERQKLLSDVELERNKRVEAQEQFL